MITVNCAALPAKLMERELFRRKKGAFTGADTRQIGRLEIANGSTLCLDEIGELESIIEPAMIMCPGPALQLADKLAMLSITLESTVRTMGEMERSQILKTFAENHRRIKGKDGAATILSLHPSTLRARMH